MASDTPTHDPRARMVTGAQNETERRFGQALANADPDLTFYVEKYEAMIRRNRALLQRVVELERKLQTRFALEFPQATINELEGQDWIECSAIRIRDDDDEGYVLEVRS